MDRPGYPRPEAWAHRKNARFLYADDSLRAHSGGGNGTDGEKRRLTQLRPREVRGQMERHFVPACISSSEVRKRIAHLKNDRLSEIFGSGLRLTEGLTGMAVLNFIRRQGLFGAKGNRHRDSGGTATLNAPASKEGEAKKQKQIAEDESGQAQATDLQNQAAGTKAAAPKKLLKRKLSSVEGVFRNVTGGDSYDVIMKKRQPSGARRIALFGGSFDPLTTAHLKMVAEIIHTAAADEVWIVPCGVRPDKPSIASPLHRYTMCQLAVVTTFSSDFPVYVRDDDIYAEGGNGSDKKSKGKMAMDTPALIELMEREYPSAEFSFVIGSNLIKDLPKWRYSKESHKNWWLTAPLIIMPRLGYPVPENFARRENVIIVGNSDLPAAGSGLVTSDAESSVLRARLKEQKQLGRNSRDDKLWCIEGLVPQAVNSYIMRYNVFV